MSNNKNKNKLRKKLNNNKLLHATHGIALFLLSLASLYYGAVVDIYER